MQNNAKALYDIATLQSNRENYTKQISSFNHRTSLLSSELKVMPVRKEQKWIKGGFYMQICNLLFPNNAII